LSRARLVALVGPTAGGKTDLAVELAQQLGAEIVSVDSRQVYRRLDIGTAKPSAEARRTVPHHLLDVVEPDEPFDAAAFARLGREAIAEIRSRGRRVVLCGGSGLYLRALSEGLCAAPPAPPELRRALRAEADTRGLAALHAELRAVDPAVAARLSPSDAPRILRALEVHRATGRPLSSWQAATSGEPPYAVRTFVLSPPVARLDERIAARAAAMWRGGLVEETEAVLRAGFAPDLAPLQAIGYREAQSYLRGEIGADDAVRAMTLATRQYAKRQRTWFRRSEASWYESSAALREMARRAEEFLAREGDPSDLS
jgi:tRNA dimethylallyltransferase